MVADRMAQVYWQVIRTHANGALVDIGCGKVPLYETYRDCTTEVVCVDWANSLHENPHVDAYANLNAGLPFSDRCFDTILATDVLEHLRSPALFWAEASRVLRPRGKVIVGVPFLYWIHEQPHDHGRYTEYRLRAWCEENGLSILSIAPYAGPLSVALDIVGKNLRGQRFATFYQGLAAWFMGTGVGRRMDVRNSEVFPLGYCLVGQKQ
jgi:2-polyprenyl-3-methyl-5-hydroxy-6-metoxy-1,4-benzoquinol methylase